MVINGIYQIQSKTKPERVYIGSAININKRWYQHISSLKLNKHHSPKLQKHYNKYGEDDLIFSILCICEKDQLIQFEQYFLDFYHPWFNICPKAGSVLGRNFSSYSRNLMRLRKLGTHHLEKTKQIMSKIKLGKKIGPFSESFCKNKSITMMGNKNSLGYKHTIEARKNMSIAHKNIIFSESHKKNMSKAQKKRYQKIQESMTLKTVA